MELSSPGTATAAKYCALKPAHTGFGTSVGWASLSVAFSITFPLGKGDRQLVTRAAPAAGALIGDRRQDRTDPRFPTAGAAISTSKRYEFPGKR